MARRRQEPVDPATLPPPAVIARQIADDLAKAQRQFAAVAKALEPKPAVADSLGQLDLFADEHPAA